ncbi:hypothetical protein [Thiohalorhabdus methylotrophus]|uniref:VIT family protein n=1 Tax=Thiohalorhabdus methylotrophus TaxID=3242694 RepID=A0ABV4TQC2_9GAMM
MQSSLKAGLHFGLTSGVITTLGLVVGLHAGTRSQLAVIGGILTIAVADALSDAMGVHVSREAEEIYLDRELWLATGATFGAKLVIALTFLVPVVLLPLPWSILVSVVWGLGLITGLSYLIARSRRVAPARVVLEHLLLALLVVGIAYALGLWVARYFGMP